MRQYFHLGPSSDERNPRPVCFHRECWTNINSLKRAHSERIAHERIRCAQAHRVECAAYADTETLVAGPPEVLDCCLQSGAKNMQGGIHFASSLPSCTGIMLRVPAAALAESFSYSSKVT